MGSSDTTLENRCRGNMTSKQTTPLGCQKGASCAISDAFSTCGLQPYSMNGAQALNILRRRRRRDLITTHRLRLKELRDASDPFMVTDEIFQGRYRLSKEVVSELINILRPLMTSPQRSTAVPLEIKVLCALPFFGHGSYQKSSGSDFNLGLSQPSVSRAIQEVAGVLNVPDILSQWIQFPMNRNERRQLIQKNHQSTRFPGILGFIDGTHVAIRAPAENEFLFVNRKSFHSMNVQIVCDSSLKIINCVSRFLGSTHDSYVWSQSAVYREMKELWESGEQCWLLGDSGYPHQPWLQTPILNAEDGTPEAHYTTAHVRARNAVERCIGVLKSRC